MAGPVDTWRAIAWAVRSIPSDFGLRPYSVSIVTGSWSGDHVGDGNKLDTLVPIYENGNSNPRVRFVNEEQRALGNLAIGACTVGPITPDHGSNGTALSDLLPAVAAHETVHVIITGPSYPNGAKFTVKEVKTDRAIHWTLVCEPTSIEP